jgi:hypothetical protein
MKPRPYKAPFFRWPAGIGAKGHPKKSGSLIALKISPKNPKKPNA